jgi:hypothetical protein
MSPRCPISKTTNSWKFVVGDSFFASEFNLIFTNGDLVAIHTHLVISKVLVEFSSSCQFWHLKKRFRKLAPIQ